MLALSKRSQFFDIAVLAVMYVVTILIVNPLGDFPLNDDWSFALAVKGLVEYGDWRPNGWTGASLITQSLWGAIFCIPAGFSFNALRFSTLISAVFGVIGVYILLVTNNRGRILAVIAALTLAFNPIYYELSFTFMTDVLFTALSILSSIFFREVHTAIRLLRSFDSVCAGGGGDSVQATGSFPAAGLCCHFGYTARLRHNVAPASFFYVYGPSHPSVSSLRGCSHALSALDERYRQDSCPIRDFGSRGEFVDQDNWLKSRHSFALSRAVLSANSSAWSQQSPARYKQRDSPHPPSAFGRGLRSAFDLFQFRPGGKMDAYKRKYKGKYSHSSRDRPDIDTRAPGEVAILVLGHRNDVERDRWYASGQRHSCLFDGPHPENKKL